MLSSRGSNSLIYTTNPHRPDCSSKHPGHLPFYQYRSHLLPVRRAKIHLSHGLKWLKRLTIPKKSVQLAEAHYILLSHPSWNVLEQTVHVQSFITIPRHRLVWSKYSMTDLDFTWVTGMARSPVISCNSCKISISSCILGDYKILLYFYENLL